MDEKQGLSQDVLIPKGRLRNRAVDGDCVAVQLLHESEWSAPSSRVHTGDDTDDADDNESKISTESTRKTGKRPTGKVVGILQRNWRSYVATIQIDKDCTPQQMAIKVCRFYNTIVECRLSL